jgi:hypothetical protein
VTFKVAFATSTGTPITYSTTQPSTITETGHNTETATIAAGQSASSVTLTASQPATTATTSTLTFGPYALNVSVGS